MTDSLTITRPDDWHLHVRDGAALQAVVPHSARQFARALIMPNLRPPVTTAQQALEYRQRILDAVPEGLGFEPVMSLYLTDRLPPEEIARAAEAGVRALKLYPAGATTNSDAGVTDIRLTYRTLEAMQRHGLLLLMHGEVTDPAVDLFDREAVFIERVLIPLRRDFPELKIVFEHLTTMEGAHYVREAGRFTAPPSRRTTCCTTATRSSPAASARTTTACRCSSVRRTASRWSRPPPAAATATFSAPTARRTRRG